jgi:hypothetical protein
MFEADVYPVGKTDVKEDKPAVAETFDSSDSIFFGNRDEAVPRIKDLKVADQVKTDSAIAELKEKFFLADRVNSVETEDGTKTRRAMELSVRNFLLRASIENPLRKAKKEIKPGEGKDALFEKAECLWKDVFFCW